MLLALIVLCLPSQAHTTPDTASSKPTISAATRPLLLPETSFATPLGAPGETESNVPEIPLTNPFPGDVPVIAHARHAEPAPPVNYFPESPISRPAVASLNATSAFEAPIKPVSREIHRQSTANRRLWYGLLVAGHSAAAFDAYSTRRVMAGPMGKECNPLLRPFAHSNSLYFAVQASPLLMDYLGRRMMYSEHSSLRRLWWVPQSVGTAISLLTGVHNMRVSQ